MPNLKIRVYNKQRLPLASFNSLEEFSRWFGERQFKHPEKNETFYCKIVKSSVENK